MTQLNTQNKKVKNATPKTYNNIKFKSLLEVMCYKTLLQEGFIPEYESRKFILWKGDRPTIKFYTQNKATQDFSLEISKLRDITYTPDFTFLYKSLLVIIEAKGSINDVYPIKRKLFRGLLEKSYPNSIFFEVKNKRQLLKALSILKSL